MTDCHVPCQAPQVGAWSEGFCGSDACFDVVTGPLLGLHVYSAQVFTYDTEAHDGYATQKPQGTVQRRPA